MEFSPPSPGEKKQQMPRNFSRYTGRTFKFEITEDDLPDLERAVELFWQYKERLALSRLKTAENNPRKHAFIPALQSELDEIIQNKNIGLDYFFREIENDEEQPESEEISESEESEEPEPLKLQKKPESRKATKPDSADSSPVARGRRKFHSR